MFVADDPSFIADPYPEFARLRTLGQVHWHEGLGQFIAVSHAAASAVLRHRSLGRLWTDATPAERFASFNMLHRNSLLENEPPAHTRLRRLVSSAFARGHVERLRPAVERLAGTMVGTLAERIAADGEADLLDDLAQPLPIAVITELLGVPGDDGPTLVAWSNAIVKMYEYGLSDGTRRAAEQAAEEFAEYLRALADQRRRRPGDDLLSHLAGSELTGDEVVATAVLLLMAGHEATVNVLGNGVHALLTHRHEWERLVAGAKDPAVVASAAEELIRYDAPLHLFERTATADVQIAGHRIAEGQKVAALLGAAARDPEVFDRPDTLDIGRSPNPHLGFGGGIHYCLGAPLARVEITAALAALARELPGLRPARAPRR
ncbi:cytochrome P450, partial [Saccharomonospora saliphila]|uniref:cytochrome P450 n=1 Tax=Saccharomonospora saliphila TaxID=369829 RepID=UPI0003765808